MVSDGKRNCGLMTSPPPSGAPTPVPAAIWRSHTSPHRCLAAPHKSPPPSGGPTPVPAEDWRSYTSPRRRLAVPHQSPPKTGCPTPVPAAVWRSHTSHRRRLAVPHQSPPKTGCPTPVPAEDTPVAVPHQSPPPSGGPTPVPAEDWLSHASPRRRLAVPHQSPPKTGGPTPVPAEDWRSHTSPRRRLAVPHQSPPPSGQRRRTIYRVTKHSPQAPVRVPRPRPTRRVLRPPHTGPRPTAQVPQFAVNQGPQGHDGSFQSGQRDEGKRRVSLLRRCVCRAQNDKSVGDKLTAVLSVSRLSPGHIVTGPRCLPKVHCARLPH